MVDISVIIPVYNTELYLKDCIDSVLIQTFSNFEIILVDDGSTDCSPFICDEYAKKDSRIRVIHKKNEGQGVARNCALEIAKGNYIFFLDSDDWLIPSALVNVFTLAKKYDVDIICFDTFYTSERLLLNSKQDEEKIELIDKKELIRQYLMSNISSTPWSKFYKRKLWEKIKFPNIKLHEDAYVLHLIFDQCENALITNQKLYVQYIRSGSSCTNFFQKQNFLCIECGERYVKFCEEKYPDLVNYALCQLIERQIYTLKKMLNDKRKPLFDKEYSMIIAQIKSEIKKLQNFNIEYKNKLIQDSEVLIHPFLYRIKKCWVSLLHFLYRCIKKIFKLFRIIK